jgi:hypothetical protein
MLFGFGMLVEFGIYDLKVYPGWVLNWTQKNIDMIRLNWFNRVFNDIIYLIKKIKLITTKKLVYMKYKQKHRQNLFI